MINYKEIIDGLKTEKVIELMVSLGASEYIERDEYIIFPTICHNEDSDEASMKLYYYKDTKLFVCYTECGTMSIFKMLEHYYQTRNIEYNWKADVLNRITECSTYAKKTNFPTFKYASIKDHYHSRQEQTISSINPHVLDVFTKYYPLEWLEDNITKEAMDTFNILYSISQNKIIIPHYNIKGELIGIRGRALNTWEVENIGKYFPVKVENTLYKHKLSLNLYGLNITLPNIKKNRIVYLFESEKSVLQLEGYQMDNCGVAVCGSHFNKYQLNILLKHCYPKEIVICFDQEEKKGKHDYFNHLWELGEKYNQYCNFSFVYDTQGLLDLKDSPTDRGEVTFKKLLSRRIQIK